MCVADNYKEVTKKENKGSECSTCEVWAYQKANVCVNVTVTPWAECGTPIVYCHGDPILNEVPNSTCPTNTEACTFTITQVVHIQIPVKFGAKACTSDEKFACLKPTLTKTCREDD
jgi:hypothetical protein